MRRSTGIAVFATAVLLVLAGNLPRVPWEAMAASWRSALERHAVAWPEQVRRSALHVPRPRPVLRPGLAAAIRPAPARLLATPNAHRPRLPGLPLGVLAAIVAGGGAGLLAALALVVALRRDRRGHVWTLARRGFTPARIASRVRVSQDAVRTLLSPGLGAGR